MQAKFGIEREKQNNLFYKEYKNDKGALHFHSQIELYFIDGGEMEVFVNDKRRLLGAGEMSVALSYTAHAYRTPSESESSVFIIPPYMCEDFIKTVKSKRAVNPFITDKQVVSKIKNYIQELRSESTNEIMLHGYIYLILGLLMDSISLVDTDESIDTNLSSNLLFYLNENFKSDITLADVAEHFGYSQSYISRYFKSCFDVGFNEYLTNIRLKNAVVLMHENNTSITCCAYESGFNSLSTFYRVFFKEFGCSPKRYYEKLQK